MRKFLTFVVLPAVILVAVWTGLSTWCGKKIEEGYRTDLGKVVQSKFLKVTLDSYRRGIWTSEAKVTAELVFPEGKNTSRSLPVRIAFTHQIYHGPIPIARGPGDQSALPAAHSRTFFGPRPPYPFMPAGRIPHKSIMYHYPICALNVHSVFAPIKTSFTG